MTETTPATLESVDIGKLLTLLPHRYPFLLVDRIIEIDHDNSAIGIKNVTVNEPHFTGHFPGQPVMPGVLVIEAMAQTAGAICVLNTMGNSRPKVVYFMTIDECRFRKPVTPGDQVRLHMTKIKNRRNMWWYKGEAKVDGVIVAEATVSAMVVME
ncbi:3-hydroxyacyl-[acyl-carrier-protein] dehydratase FabZ [Labrys miyagiensis]|uniref:3-hydroxyacyl-[acyl-carrier-protein] dehydratase FabZ n=1 Tax=Labrys miyagiensis TaxID=346912 RepID=A0ABQ6CLI4_9HYPH|nr:3-hydroxyacyl-ACP dehydratase FabZ [Labrys miyagiensis]GLS21166.1 3-hydroxyacyl-[acyl-carrier-protein] dehydratase FabZ [Labrys miyagiensis]